MSSITGVIDAGLAFEILHFVFDTGVAIYVYLARKNSVTNERIDKLTAEGQARMNDYAVRIARLEQVTRDSPTHQDLAALYARVNEVSDTVNAIRGELKAIHNTVSLVQEHLINRRDA